MVPGSRYTILGTARKKAPQIAILRTVRAMRAVFSAPCSGANRPTTPTAGLDHGLPKPPETLLEPMRGPPRPQVT
jgi:hypothetical protein